MATARQTPGPLPLAGITVVSLEQAVAAPFATRQLADLGARVIKVERPGGGDFARRYDTTVHGQASYFVWLNRSKESLTLDLKSDEGLEILHELLAGADVFVQNLAPGAADRLGLSADELQARYPSLIPCTVSGYGTSGSWADRKAYDLLVQCQTGLLSLTGTPDEAVRAASRWPTSRAACTPTAVSCPHCSRGRRRGEPRPSRSLSSTHWPSG